MKRNAVKNIIRNDVNILNGVDSTKQEEERQEKRNKKKTKKLVTFTYI